MGILCEDNRVLTPIETCSQLKKTGRTFHLLCARSFESESFGVVLIEAMSFGLPIVKTRWRGIPDVVGASGGAFIVEPRQSNLLAEKLEVLIGDRELRTVMGRKNRVWFCEYYH